MSVDKILSGEYEVILLDKEGFTQPQTVDFQQVLRLAKLGAEAEKELTECYSRWEQDNGYCPCYGCRFRPLCKSRRKGK